MGFGKELQNNYAVVLKENGLKIETRLTENLRRNTVCLDLKK